MAEIISMDNFHTSVPPRKNAREWPDEWFDGNPRLYTKNTDFPGIRASSFRKMIIAEAKRRGLRVRTVQPDDNTVMVCAVLPNTKEK